MLWSLLSGCCLCCELLLHKILTPCTNLDNPITRLTGQQCTSVWSITSLTTEDHTSKYCNIFTVHPYLIVGRILYWLNSNISLTLPCWKWIQLQLCSKILFLVETIQTVSFRTYIFYSKQFNQAWLPVPWPLPSPAWWCGLWIWGPWCRLPSDDGSGKQV